nr:E3 ubiquitin-protein ligase ORTHRUS 2-like [Quercus suber]POF20430.1 e3 ubiquitin-protein ligase orthrus 2 [Quercus suber]
MAPVSELPCDGDGACMVCKEKPSDEDKLTCKTCVTPWHLACLKTRPETLASALHWECPDCTSIVFSAAAALPVGNAAGGASDDLISKIRAIEADASLTDREKAKKRQELVSGKACCDDDADKKKKKKQQKRKRGEKDEEDEDEDEDEDAKEEGEKDVLDVLDGSLNCSFCMQLPERPVTTPCGHNFCLKCFQKWVGQGKRTCAKCRCSIPPKMASQPRINSTLVAAIRMAKVSKSIGAGGPSKVYHFVHNQNRPDKAYMTERAQRKGKSNAASGKIFVTVAPDHFGPIPAENDPERNQGVLVGECWEDRLECRQWGAHLPHVAGIAGQSNHGAQSVALSGGYLDDEDHGEWFLYTGSGGRDLSGNKRTNKDQSFDQTFEKMNKSLQVSCLKGYPVRVVRSHKEKRSSYAPEKGVRYDGVYRIEKCWRKVGIQGFKVCRYLFVRCDNEPAPWTSDEHGDRPRPLPVISELKKANDIVERKENPAWDFDEEAGCWKWKKPPPPSKKPVRTGSSDDIRKTRKVIRQAKNVNVREKLLKEFSCLICRQVMTFPITTPCAHNFCKSCLEGAFAGKTFVRERSRNGRSLRSQKNVMCCPSCPTDISDFLENPQVNRELMDVIESLKSKTEEENGNYIEESIKETDGSEESADHSSTSSDTNTEIPDNIGVDDSVQSHPEKSKPNRSRKQENVVDGECSIENKDGLENELSSEKADAKSCSPKHVDGECSIENKDGMENKLSSEKADAKSCSPKQGVGAKTRSRKAENALDENNGVGVKARGRKAENVVDENNGVGVKTRARKAETAVVENNGVGVKTRGRKSRKVVDEGNGSPSSPLHVRADDDDFE